MSDDDGDGMMKKKKTNQSSTFHHLPVSSWAATGSSLATELEEGEQQPLRPRRWAADPSEAGPASKRKAKHHLRRRWRRMPWLPKSEESRSCRKKKKEPLKKGSTSSFYITLEMQTGHDRSGKWVGGIVVRGFYSSAFYTSPFL